MTEKNVYRWYEQFTTTAIKDLTGVDVSQVTVGLIETGVVLEDGTPEKQWGIEVEFAAPPPPTALEKLDVLLAYHQRPGGTNVASKLEILETQVSAMETES